MVALGRPLPGKHHWLMSAYSLELTLPPLPTGVQRLLPVAASGRTHNMRHEAAVGNCTSGGTNGP